MNRYNIVWHFGGIAARLEDIKPEQIIEHKVVEAEDIDEVQYLNILPKDIREKVYYTRGLLIDETNRSYDYGSWSKFILVNQIKD